MGIPAFNWIVLPHMILLVPDIIAAIAIIAAAVAVIIEVVVAVTIVYTIPGEAVLMTDTAEAAPDGDLIHRTHHNPSNLDDTTAGHDLHVDLTEDVDPTPIVGAGLNHPEQDMAIIAEVIMVQSLQIANPPGMPPGLPGRSNTE